MRIAVAHRENGGHSMKTMSAMHCRRVRHGRIIMASAMVTLALLIAPARPAQACDPYTDPTCSGPTTPRVAAGLACQDPCGRITAACNECWKASVKAGEPSSQGSAKCGNPGTVFPPDGSGCH